MKKLFVAAVLFSLVFSVAFAQDNAGLYASGEYRTAEEALAAQNFVVVCRPFIEGRSMSRLCSLKRRLAIFQATT